MGRNRWQGPVGRGWRTARRPQPAAAGWQPSETNEEIERTAKRVQELEAAADSARRLQHRMLGKAEQAMDKDDEEAKAEATQLLAELEGKLRTARGLLSMLKDEAATRGIRDDLEAEDYAFVQDGLETGGWDGKASARFTSGLEERLAWKPKNQWGDWAAFLPQLASALLTLRLRKPPSLLVTYSESLTRLTYHTVEMKDTQPTFEGMRLDVENIILQLRWIRGLPATISRGSYKPRPVQRVWSNPIMALSSLKALSDAQEKSRYLWEFEEDSGTANSYGADGWEQSNAVSLPESQRLEALFAASLIENAYKGPESLTWFAELSSEGSAKGLEILRQIREAKRHQPSCCILREKWDDELIVCVRGTDEVSDILTLAEAQPTPLLDGACHRGAYLSACWLCKELQPVLEQYKPNKVHLMGHSLGAAVVVAMAALLDSDPMFSSILPWNSDVRVSTFGCPPVIQRAPQLDRIMQEQVTSYVNGDDIVCRLSEYNVEVLLGQAVQCQRMGPEEFGKLIAEHRRRLFGSDASVSDDPPAVSPSMYKSLRQSKSFVVQNTSTTRMIMPGRIWYMQNAGGVPKVKQLSGDLMADDCIPLVQNSIRDHRLFAYKEALGMLC